MNIEEINKVITYVGFAIKSNKIIWGADNILEYKKKIHLVIVSDDINKSAMNKLSKDCEIKNIRIIVVDIKTLKAFTKKDNCKAIAIRDYNLANAIKDKFGVM